MKTGVYEEDEKKLKLHYTRLRNANCRASSSGMMSISWCCSYKQDIKTMNILRCFTQQYTCYITLTRHCSDTAILEKLLLPWSPIYSLPENSSGWNAVKCCFVPGDTGLLTYPSTISYLRWKNKGKDNITDNFTFLLILVALSCEAWMSHQGKCTAPCRPCLQKGLPHFSHSSCCRIFLHERKSIHNFCCQTEGMFT